MKSYRLDSTRNSNTWQKDKSLWETDQTEIEVKDNKAKIGTKCKRIPAGQPKNKP